jgi:hypothetical protein
MFVLKQYLTSFSSKMASKFFLAKSMFACNKIENGSEPSHPDSSTTLGSYPVSAQAQ